ncbi:MAG: ACP S-malonyltransferase [Rhodospirillaceae bacterium]|jgi:[acyl-carrier-protein] S-malonyltransferase|nr:ACP S-malonyltransferase [Rhodospirillaceae bacterium]MBT5945682.1 ACP S-malonyltransferase [Rhodospirillaceae bacterium]MBT6404356.1 ACP S-malonyltransferase [Rhodospirillaceae bacterium]MBT6537133.1 ACP S-malonyltransferase [Rhodospirillaceae bacterium]MBT7363000.1 ACP S-malonyltransferase [Rhodospirillaceae bacterium]
MNRAFVFPGQGSQEVGMGQSLAEAFPAARLVFEEVDDALETHLSRIIFEGPQEELTLTQNAQPALMAVSMAVVRVLEEEGGIKVSEAASYVAGHSLGEYSALAASGALSIADTARLLQTRGEAMQAAVPVGVGAMAAVLGPSLEEVEAIAAEAAGDQVCDVANDNSDGQVVVSGNTEAVERAVEIAKERGARRAILLPVSAPFHCSLLDPAADVMTYALASAEISAPNPPVIANVTAAAVTEPDEIRNLLIEQVTSRVRWREGVLAMRDLGVEELCELGAGKVLSGLTRRIDRDMTSRAIGTPEDIEAFIGAL